MWLARCASRLAPAVIHRASTNNSCRRRRRRSTTEDIDVRLFSFASCDEPEIRAVRKCKLNRIILTCIWNSAHEIARAATDEITLPFSTSFIYRLQRLHWEPLLLFSIEFYSPCSSIIFFPILMILSSLSRLLWFTVNYLRIITLRIKFFIATTLRNKI